MNIYEIVDLVVQIIMWLIYIGGSIGVALMLAYIVMESQLKLPKEAKFFAGLSLTPYFIGLYMFVLGFLSIRLPNVLYYLPLYLASLIYFCRRGRYNFFLDRIKGFKNDNFNGKKLLIENVFLFLLSHIFMFISDYYEENIAFASVVAVFFGGVVLLLSLIKNEKKSKQIRIGLWLANYLVIYGLPLALPLVFEKRRAILFGQAFLGLIIMLYVFVFLCNNTNDAMKDIFRSWCIYGAFWAYFALSFTLREHNRVCKYLFVVAVAAIAVIMMFSDKNNYLVRKQYVNWIVEKFRIFVWLAVFVLLYTIIKQAVSPIAGSDAVEYLSNALEYTKTMRIADVNSYMGQEDGRLLAIIHHPGYVLYLAFALLHAPVAKMGYPFDWAVRAAFTFNIFYVIFAICGLVCVFKPKNKRMACGVSLLCIFSYDRFSGFILDENSRDAYRIIPLMIFAMLLIALSEKQKSKFIFLAIVVCSACIMIGHPLNAIQAVIILVTYLVWLIIVGKFDKRVLFWGIAGSIGALLGAYQIVSAYLKTGSMTGGLIDIERILEPTIYYENFMNGRAAANTEWIDRVGKIIFRGNGEFIIFLAILLAVLGVEILYKRDKHSIFYFLTGIVLLQYFSICDVVSWSGFSLSQWYSLNSRYTLQMYVFAGILIGVVFDKVYNDFRARKSIVCIMMILLIFPIWRSLATWNETTSFGGKQEVAERYAICNEVIPNLEVDNGNILIDNYFCNYYLKNKGISFFTPRCEEIRAAKNMQELDSALKKQNIEAVLIHEKLVEEWWHDTILLDYLCSEEYVEYANVGNGVTLYMLREGVQSNAKY